MIANAETLAFFATRAFDTSGRSDDFRHTAIVSAANRLVIEAAKEGIGLGNVDVIDFQPASDCLKLISGGDTHSVRIKRSHMGLTEPFSGRYSDVLC
jgi:hypothetical protein